MTSSSAVNMPGALGESPLKPPRIKPGYDTVPAGPPDTMTLSDQAFRWGLSAGPTGATRTRSQRREAKEHDTMTRTSDSDVGLDRPEEGGDRPDENPTMGLDRSENSDGGRLSEDLD